MLEIDTTINARPPSRTLTWLRTHPYWDAIIGSAALMLVGALIVNGHVKATPLSSDTWIGNQAAFLTPDNSAVSQQRVVPSNPVQPTQTDASYTPVPVPTANTTPPPPTKPLMTADTFDYDAFIAMLSSSGRAPASSKSTASSSTISAYAYLPSGLVSTTTVQKRTATQQTLYDYGNDLGSYIQSFEEQNPDQATLVKNQVEDRTDPAKAQVVEALGANMRGLGQAILAMDQVPAAMSSLHQKLGKGYIDMGTKLALVPQTQSDADFLGAIQTYNNAVLSFENNYIAMAQLFASYGVVFTPSDAGSVFTFTPVSL